jgi:Ala-tRNA(Pro) deacylase
MIDCWRNEESIMFYVSAITDKAPLKTTTALQALVYEKLAEWNIPFERADTDVAVTMEDCAAIDAKLRMAMVKTLFLCDENKEHFYLFITAGNKRFAGKAFSEQLNCPRVSFAPIMLFERMLGTPIGAATIFSTLLDEDQRIQVVFDQSVASQEYYGCSDGTTTCFLKIKTEDILHKFLIKAHHEAKIIED